MLALCLLLSVHEDLFELHRVPLDLEVELTLQVSKRRVYLVNNVFIVSNEFLEGNNRLPRVVLSVDATASDLTVLVSGYSQRVSAINKITKVCTKIECKTDKCVIPFKLIAKAYLDHEIPFSSLQPRGKTLLACELYWIR